MDVGEAIAKRRSIRRFKPKDVSDKAVFQLLESARLAPSATNKQPWRFVVVRDRERKDRLVEACFRQRSVREAPVVIVCLVDMTPGPRMSAEEIAAITGVLEPLPGTNGQRPNKTPQRLAREAAKLKDASIAIEHICLRAVELGLGTCWIGMFDEQMVKEAVNAPEQSFVSTVLPIGYPGENPPPRKRLPLQMIAFSEEYGRGWELATSDAALLANTTPPQSSGNSV